MKAIIVCHPNPLVLLKGFLMKITCEFEDTKFKRAIITFIKGVKKKDKKRQLSELKEIAKLPQ